MIFDILIILIFLLAIFRGWHKGGIKTLFSFLTYIISFAIAYSCRNWMATWAMKLPFAAKISEWVNSGASTAVGEASKLPFISGGIASGADSLTYFIMQIISVIVIFIIVALILGIIAKILTKVINFIQLGFLNRILGAILGAFKGYIIVYIFSLIFFAISGWFPWLANIIIGSHFANNLPNPISLIGNLIGRFF